MKKVMILVSCCILITSFAIAQKKDTSAQLSTQALSTLYLQKRKTNNTVGYVLVGSGITLMGIGALTDYNEHVNSTFNGVGETLFYSGLTASLISIPFFIAARQNKNKAKLTLKNEGVFIGDKMLSKSGYTALSFTIKL